MGKIKTAADTHEFKTVEFFRKVKKRIAKETYNMTFEELKAYLKSRSKWIMKK